jgi:uncharacterized OsmC-like protein/TusA-related sulfurtransferase
MSTEQIPAAEASCDGGDLDCGSGLLLIIRNAMMPVSPGGVLEVRSRETSVKEDLPAWCRLVGHDLLATRAGTSGSTSYFIRKKLADSVLQHDLKQAQNHSWRARIRCNAGLEANVYVRNHSFSAGQPVSFDVADKSVSAMEYMLGALGACIAVGFQWRASRRGINLQNLEVAVQARLSNVLVYLGLEDEGHPGVTGLHLVVYVDSEADESLLKEVLLDTIRRSPMTQTLHHSVTTDVEIRKIQ